MDSRKSNQSDRNEVVSAMGSDRLLRVFRVIHPSDKTDPKKQGAGFDGVGTIALCFESGYCVQLMPDGSGSDLRIIPSLGPDAGDNRVMGFDGKIIDFNFADVTGYSPWTFIAHARIVQAKIVPGTDSVRYYLVIQCESGMVRVWAEDDELYADVHRK